MAQARQQAATLTQAPAQDAGEAQDPMAALQARFGNGFLAAQVANGVTDPARLAGSILDGVPARPLPDAARLEQAFGTDLSGVRVHTGAGELQAMGADAVALGADRIGFASSSPSLEQQAHEVAHTLQSGSGTATGTSRPGDAAEREAHAAGAAVAGGDLFSVEGYASGELQGDWLGDVWRGVRRFFRDMFGDDERQGRRGGGGGGRGWGDDKGGEELPETPPVPAVDLTAWTWLLDLYTRVGTNRQEAEALVQSATDAQRALATNPPASDAPAATEPATPSASIDTHRSNRARPLEWSYNPNNGHIRSEVPEGMTGPETRGQSMAETFGDHRALLFAQEFGEGVTQDQVRGAIAFADAMGRADTAGALRARLFRAAQYAVVETLNVEDSGRYTPGANKTYCNIYAFDVVTALGAYIPRTWWYDAVLRRIQAGEEAVSQTEYNRRVDAGEPVAGLIHPVYGETVREMNANDLNAWMRSWGASFGWTQAADMTAAQDAANSGKVVVILAANSDPSRSGHISVVLAEREGDAAARDGEGNVRAPLQSQAGARNFKTENNDAGEGRDQWWENASHTEGAAWINNGSGRSPLITPESLGR